MQSVYNYEDPIKYIQDFISHKRETDSNFSFQKLSSELGFSSPAGFVEILKGKKNIRPAVVSSIIEKIGLDKSEYPFFLSMVAKSRSSTEIEERLYDLFLTDLSPVIKKPINVKRFTDGDFFSHWIFTTILALAELKNFKMTPQNIQASLREHLPIEIIEAALNRVLENELLSINEDGFVVLAHDFISTENDKKHSSVKNYFVQIADLSKKAIDFPLEEREFQSFSLVLEKDQIPLAKDIIRKCRNNLTSLARPGGEVVYQMNMNFFPLTKISE